MDGVENIVLGARPDDPAEEARVLADVEQALFARPSASPTVGRYQLGRVVGSGAFGSVYEGFDPELERAVAIKLVRRSASTAGDPDARMLREAKLLARLSHPNVVAVHDVGTTDLDPARTGASQIYIVLELVEGTTLRQWLRAQPRSPSAILDAFTAAGRGLAAAHAKGIVHRDFKPDNVLVGADGRVRVSDFGLARTSSVLATVDDHACSPSIEATTITSTGALVGTPVYMAPEQHDGQPGDARSDQFAFCVALWEALARERPFQGDVHALAQAKRARPLPRPRGLPRAIRRVLARGLSPDPNDRHRDLASALAALEAARRRPLRLAAAAVLVCLLGAAAWWARSSAMACEESQPPLSPADREAVAAVTSVAIQGELSRWLDRWSAERSASCRAESHARTACLDRQARVLVAFVDVLRTAEPAAIEVAPRRLAALPDLEPCLGDNVPTVAVWSPAHASIAAEIEAAGALADAGSPADALARIEPALALADLAHALALHAEALHVRARVRRELGDHTEAAADIDAALPEAELAGDEILTAEIAITQVLVTGVVQDRVDAGRALVGPARARIQGAGLEAMLEPRLVLIEGRIDVIAGDYGQARARFEQVREMIEATHGRNHPMLADIENNVGVTWEREGELARAHQHYTASIAMIESAYGEDHPAVGRRLLNLAMVDFRLANVAAAEADVRRALGIFERQGARQADSVAKASSVLATILLEAGRCEEALAASDRALTMRRQRFSARHREVATSLIDHARALIDCNEAASALPPLAEAREILAGSDAAPWLLQRTYFNEGWALRELGRIDEAVAAHHRAVELAEREHGREHIDVAAALTELARDHRALRDTDAARVAAEEAVAIYGRADERLADAAAARTVLAEVLRDP